MKKIYLLSGPLKDNGFPPLVKDELKMDLGNVSNCVMICTKPDNFITNDIYKDKMINDLNEISNIRKFILIDNRIDKKVAVAAIKDADLVYLLGGNPISQIKYIKDNKFDILIRNSKAVIIGTSAGAMNLGRLAYYSKDEDCDTSIFYEGLGLVDLTIDPHFNISDIMQVSEAKKMSYQNKIIGLPNFSAIVIFDKNIKYIGEYYIIDNGKLEIKNNI